VSRIGKQPVAVPDGVEINIEPELVSVKGPKGELSERKSREIEVKQEDGQILVTRPTDRGEHRALHGLTRSLIANMVEGVTNGFEKRLEIQGVGYRANLQGNKLVLALGYSHPVAPARALQGQGHPLRGRVRAAEGR
jgi:large subunit ribosomal protein L6